MCYRFITTCTYTNSNCIEFALAVSSVFCCALGQIFKSQAKKYHPFSCIPIFDKLLKIYNYKKCHRNKYAYINTKKIPF